MAKAKSTIFFCQNCGYESAKWMGQCPSCHEWNTFVEEQAVQKTPPSFAGGSTGRFDKKKALPLKDVSASEADRMTTGIAEMDRVLGGGLVRGSLVLVGGDPGIGKSTLLLQVCRNLSAGVYACGKNYEDCIKRFAQEEGADTTEKKGEGDTEFKKNPAQNAITEVRKKNRGQEEANAPNAFLDEVSGARYSKELRQDPVNILYVSGEESQRQIKLRANRIGKFGDSLLLLCETNLAEIQEAITSLKPRVVVIDSIQTMYSEAISSSPGSVSQVREATGVLLKLAKGLGVTIFIVGHVTKEGAVAGPRVLEHMVDTVLYFEGDRHASFRILHAVKNRFGSTDEIGVFEMKQDGLAQVADPSKFMLEGRPEGASGSVVACSMEGSRPVLIEVQALTAASSMAFPRRTADGTDLNRVNLLLAVLERRLGMKLSGMDVYVNIAGGVKMREPAVDLGIVTAVISSYKDIAVDEKTLVFGEVGLSGEIRSVRGAAIRIREAQKLGFARVILPYSCVKAVGGVKGIELVGVRTVRDAARVVTGLTENRRT